MCIFLNLADGMVANFYESIKSGKTPEGKPWTREGIQALKIYFNGSTIRELVSLHELISDGFVVSNVHGDHVSFDYGPNHPVHKMRADMRAEEERIFAEMLEHSSRPENNVIIYDEFIDEFGDEFASLDESPDEESEDGVEEELEDDDEILEDEDEVLQGEDPPAAALPSSLTDLLKVTNDNRILEAA